jgi:uncharacterized protein
MNGSPSFSVVIIGSGPSGLAAAYQLVKNGINGKQIFLMDKGDSLENRLTFRREPPELVTLLDNEVHGEGGAGLFSDGKLSGYPAGSGLFSIIGEANTKELYEQAEALLSFLGGHGNNYVGNEELTSKVSQMLEQVGLNFKYYPSRYVKPYQLYDIVKNFRRHLNNAGVAISFLTELIDIDFPNGNLKKTITFKTNDEIQTITCNHVVLALGKPGGAWIKKLADKAAIETILSPIEIGLRIEVSSSRRRFDLSLTLIMI